MRLIIIVCWSLLVVLLALPLHAQTVLPPSLTTYIQQDTDKAHQVIRFLLYRKREQYQQDKHNILKQRQVDRTIDMLYTQYILAAQYDTETDSSIHKRVSPTHKYHNQVYKPDDLIVLENTPTLTINTKLPPSQRQFRQVAYNNLLELANAFYAQFHQPLYINSSRRSYHEQQNRFHPSCFAAGICALPGTSEHQNGLTLDIAYMHGPKYLWMQNNAHLYGFHQSYQRGLAIDGIQAEPRHRRYLGTTLVTDLYHRQMTFSEWYASK